MTPNPIFSFIPLPSSERDLLILPIFTGKEVIYSDLSEADIEKMERNGEVDGWILALPNGVGAKFLAAIDKGARERVVAQGEKKGVVVDLSADFRFEKPGQSDWVYGLPGKHVFPCEQGKETDG